jgi:hypothetical protein
MHYPRIGLAALVVLACAVGLIPSALSAGPGITLNYASAIRDMHVTIKSARLPDGTAFPSAGAIGGESRPDDINPLGDEAVMGAAPDRRALPEFVDFEWRESPPAPPEPTPMDQASAAHKEWETKMMAEFSSHPIKRQRVFVRSRVPPELVSAATEIDRQTPRSQLAAASVKLSFIWTDRGIKLRWELWHRTGVQYYSHQGGDEIVPAGKTMIAVYSSTIEDDKHIVGLADGYPVRHPAAPYYGTFFSGAPGLGYTNRPLSGGEKPVAFESEPELPEWVDFRWALFPKADVARNPGESETAYYWRSLAIYAAVPRKNERVLVSSRIPQGVRDEITAATRNAQPHKVASSVLYLYFVWTDSGIKLHWRLKRSQPDESFRTVLEGGDEISPPTERRHSGA